MLKELAVAVSLVAVGLPALAQDNQTMQPQSAAPATPEVRAARQALRQACAADVANLCKDVQPGSGKIMMCLRDHRADLSAGCKSAWQNLRAARGGGTH